MFLVHHSGKSFTIKGDDKGSNEKEQGLLIKTIQEILNLIEINKQGNQGRKRFLSYSLKINIFQVYNESIYDILSKDYSTDIKLLPSEDKKLKVNTAPLSPLISKEIRSLKDLEVIFKESNQFKKLLTQFLKVNDMNKKSNIVYSLTLEKIDNADIKRYVRKIKIGELLLK